MVTNPAAPGGPVTSTLININSDPNLWAVIDPEIGRENPVEDKHRRLVRSHRTGPLDRELKPNADIRDDLNVSSIVYENPFRQLIVYPFSRKF